MTGLPLALQGAQPGAPGSFPQPFPPSAPPGGSLAGAGGMELFVVRLRHARAADVAATVNALYGRGGALGEIGQRRGTLNDQLNANRVAPYGQPAPDATAVQGQPGNLSGNVVIVPDQRTNSLLVRASAAEGADGALNAPVISTRAIQTQLLVRDGARRSWAGWPSRSGGADGSRGTASRTAPKTSSSVTSTPGSLSSRISSS